MSQPRPDGTPWKVTEEWLAWARMRMEELGINQSELADHIGVTKMAISDILRGETRHTKLLPQINKVLGGAAPTQTSMAGIVDELKGRIDDAWDALEPSERALLVQVAHALKRSRSG